MQHGWEIRRDIQHEVGQPSGKEPFGKILRAHVRIILHMMLKK
jgi:sirohydrochlorin ferrochelatase